MQWPAVKEVQSNLRMLRQQRQEVRKVICMLVVEQGQLRDEGFATDHERVQYVLGRLLRFECRLHSLCYDIENWELYLPY